MRHVQERKTRLADAAIDVLGADGVRALTHRAVDARAGLPQGTCSYHFPTRNTLLTAALERIAELDLADAEAVGRDLGAIVERWAGSPRTRARFMLMLDPQARAELGPAAQRLADGFVQRAEQTVGARARLLIALVDGLLLDELTRGTVAAEERRERLAAIGRIVTTGR